MESHLGENLTEVEAADAATAFSGRGVVLEILGWKDGSLESHKMAVNLFRQLAQDTEKTALPSLTSNERNSAGRMAKLKPSRNGSGKPSSGTRANTECCGSSVPTAKRM